VGRARMSEGDDIMQAGDRNSIELFLTRIEGKLDRYGDRMTRFESDMKGMQDSLHRHGNELQIISALDLRNRITTADTRNASTDARITTLENAEQQRKGAMNAIKILYGIGGVAATGAVGVVIRLLSTGGVH